MTTQRSFNEAKKEYFQTLKQYVPVVDKVHGGHHPEFHDVRKFYESIVEKTKEAGSERPELTEEFSRLRDITDDYKVPDDVCESYQAVYQMLSEIDKAYNGQA